MSNKSQLMINVDIESKGRKCEIIENSVTSIMFQVSDTTTRYVYKIHMRGMRNQSETTERGLKNLEFKKECGLPVKTRTETNQVFELSEKYRGNIMLVEFFKYEGVPVLCASCVLIVKPSELRITQVFFKDSTGKEVGCGSVRYEADLKFSLRVKYNRPLLRGEKAPKLQCKGYCTNATTGKYEEISKFSLDENAAYTDTIYCNDGLQESHAGADYVISLGINDSICEPPFYLENTKRLAPSIQKIHLISREARKRQIMSVVWSSKEMIKFGESSTQRKYINRNEDGFLHIHTRGMYGQKVRVELYEKDSTGIKRLLLGLKNNVTILDNAVCVPIEMSGVYAKAKKGRFFLAEGFSFEIMAKVTPLDTSIAAFEQEDESIELMVYGKADEDKAAKSTINGTMKFVIADVEKDEKEEKKEGKCPRCNQDITLDEIKKICVDSKGNCMIKDESQLVVAINTFNELRQEFKINTCLRKVHFISQICEETHFYKLEEDLNYTEQGLLDVFPKKFETNVQKTYAKQWGINDKNLSADKVRIGNYIYSGVNGNNYVSDTNLGDINQDGYRYRGRGFIQITGKTNYQKISDKYNDWIADKLKKERVDWVNNEKQLLVGADAMAATLTYWRYANILSRTDKGTTDDAIKVVTYKINGGFNGLDERRRLLNKAIEVLAANNCIDANRRTENQGTVVVVGGISTQAIKNFAAYPVYVYRGMTLETYKDMKAKNKLPPPDFETTFGRDALKKGSEKKPILHSDKRYGSNNECPPGEYYLNSRADANGGKYKMYISDKPTGKIINGIHGERAGIALHQYTCSGSQGCLTSLEGNSTTKVDQLLDEIPDLFVTTQLKNSQYPITRSYVRIIIEEREVEEDTWEDSKNGTKRWRGKVVTEPSK